MAKKKAETAEQKESAQINDTESSQTKPQFAIQRIYLKDVSLESPQSPLVFLEKDWNPEINVELNTNHNSLNEGVHEVILSITVTSKIKDKVVFLVEAQHAGVFSLSNLTGEPLDRALRSFCPNILFPYVRETISDLVQRGGFPPIYLAPVNFDALYERQKAQAESAEPEQKKAS